MARLGVNIDHVATLRQARYREAGPGLTPEPDPRQAAQIAVRAGAAGITVHLREDRRHIQEADVRTVRRHVRTVLNLEMAVTPGMTRQALRLKPDEICLVPENRREITTEGGLDAAGQLPKIKKTVTVLRKAGIRVSLFIDPDLPQVRAAAAAGADDIELHTGAYANTTSRRSRTAELRRHRRAADLAQKLGLRVNAGHGLNYDNVTAYLRVIPETAVLNIGHAIVSRALFTGFAVAVRDMVRLIKTTP